MEILEKILKQNPLEIHVAMLGPRRAGKTSMLSAMYERFENALIAEQVAGKVWMTADADTSKTLSANYMELIDTIVKGGNIAGAITGDSEAHAYRFALKKNASVPEAQIRLLFQDYPGGWLMAGANNPGDSDYAKVLDFVRNSQILLVAVDAPYLMEDGGKWHDRRNLPSLIAKTVREAWATSDETPRTVLLVPIKCEKYDKTPDGRCALINATKNGYSELLSVLATMPRCAVICVPAQTTGCVIFDHFQPISADDEIPSPVFSMPSKPDDRKYNPKDCSQALRFSLVYALNRYIKEGKVGLGGAIRNFFKLDRKFAEGAEILGAGCRGTVFQKINKGGGIS